MPKRTNEFQQLVYLIQHQMKDRPDTVITESKILVDRNTGNKREADITLEFTANGVPIVLAFECRSRSRKPTIEWVEQMLKKHEHLSDKLVLVANRPFAADALDKARREGAETVELSAATKTDWKAQIDRYTHLLLQTFDFEVRRYEATYDSTDYDPRISIEQVIYVTDPLGKQTPLTEAVIGLVNNHEFFGKRVIEIWRRKPMDQRNPEHTVTVEYVLPPDQPRWISQDVLSYPLQKLVITVGAKIHEAPLKVAQVVYKAIRVVHGTTALETGTLAGRNFHFLLMEQQGRQPKVAMMVSGTKGATRPQVRTLEWRAPEMKTSI